jgi:uncharacterized phiE125 gp8 family phage protein
MARKVITEPAAEALTAADVAEHLKAYPAEAAAMAASYARWITAARQAAEGELLRPILPQTCSLRVEWLSTGLWLWNDVLEIVSVQYEDEAGGRESLPASAYRLGDESRLLLIGSRPAGRDFEVTFKAGAWSAPDKVPDSIKAWMLLQIGTLAANPEGAGAVQTYALPPSVTEIYLRRYAAISI